MAGIYLPLDSVMTDPKTGIISRPWARYAEQQAQQIEVLENQGLVTADTHAKRLLITPVINIAKSTLWLETDRKVAYLAGAVVWTYALGVMRATRANQPTDLGTNDTGLLLFVSDFGHLMRWTGTAWEFAEGDVGNGFFRDFAVNPPESGWQLCDGTVTTYLTLSGATLTTTSFTTPNLTGTAAYRKSATAYSGTVITTGGNLTGGGAVDPNHIEARVYFRR